MGDAELLGTMDTLTVSEIFGPTVQGEGPSAGRRCVFVRLGRCNLDCKWCDTPYTWDWKGKNGTAYDPAVELHKRSVDDVVAELSKLDVEPRLTVITGGEPLLQRSALTQLVTKLPGRIEIETNGTQPPLYPRWDRMVQYNVSPKLANSGIPESKRLKDSTLSAFAVRAQRGSAIFKFVCQTPEDVHEVQGVQLRHQLPSGSIWIMPEGRSAAELHRPDVADLAVRLRYHVTGRLHVALWGDERGR